MDVQSHISASLGEEAGEQLPADARAAWENRDLKALAAELLEFPKILALLSGHTRFFLSQEMAWAVEPQSHPDDVARLQAETAEARELLDSTGDIGLSGTADLRPLVQRAALDGVLSGKELVQIANMVNGIWDARRVVTSIRPRVPRLAALADEVPDLRWLRERIFAAVSDRGDVLDDATPRLGRLRQRVAAGYRKLVTLLEGIASRQSVRPALQSSAIATRGDRLVLEVRSDQRRHVPGIVHDVSHTGATLFVEPFHAVDLCNAWRETAAEAVREEEKVLRRLSSIVGSRADEVQAAIEATAALDLIVARARLARAMGGEAITALPPDGPLRARLVSARHPLLGRDAVPVTLSIGPGFSGLVMTGPNTGGKTVALKTLGLLALMHQSGLQVPAAPESQLAVFDSVLADIGDAQSIERSVSTFSSHFGNVVRILRQAGRHSLVLLDELGTGTDPEEGSALARAILARLVERGIAAVITTHHRSVAEFAGASDGLQNASVELDPNTMLPTYQVTMGIPGRSYALSVAERLGLDGELIRKASDLLDPRHQRAEELLSTLQTERDRVRRAAQSAEQELSDAEAARRELQRKLSSVTRRQEDMVERTRRELRRETEEVRRSLRKVVDEAKEDGDLAVAKRAVNRLRQTLAGPTWFPIAGSETESDDQDVERAIAPGDSVEVKGLNAQATVVAVTDDGMAELMMGNSRVQLDTRQLRLVEKVPAGPEAAAAEVVRVDVAGAVAPGDALDLRGARAHEVRDRVAVFVDRCVLAGLHTCLIVHGGGTGAVRDAVRDALAEMPEATAFGPADPSKGGNGATQVTLA